MQLEIKSPCIGLCAMDDLSGFCHGCYRTIDEIKAWSAMSGVEKKNLEDQLEERQLQITNFD